MEKQPFSPFQRPNNKVGGSKQIQHNNLFGGYKESDERIKKR